MRPIFYIRQALNDIAGNKILHALAVTTISLIFLLTGSFTLVFVNISQLMASHQDNVRMMIYLDPDLTARDFAPIQKEILKVPRVKEAIFVSRAQALANLKKSMEKQAGLLDGLNENPLPDAFEVIVSPGPGGWDGVKKTAAKLEAISGVEEANFGQAWLEKFSALASMARVAAVALGSLLMVAALSITANTIRLVLYNRREEIRIMELVGATNGFIRASFYIQGMIQGFLGGLLALAILAFIFFVVVAGLPTHELLGRFEFRFIPVGYCLFGLVLAVLMGAAGCHLSFAQLQKD